MKAPEHDRKDLGLGTRLVDFDACPEDPYRPTSTPLYQTATFAQEDPGELGAYDYSRSGNPTRTVLERQVAELERGTAGFAFASGMAAIAAVLRQVRPESRVVVGDDLYGGTYRLLLRIVAPMGVDVVRVDTRDLAALEQAIVGGPTVLVWIETPSNPLQEVTDIRAVAELAHRYGARLAVDNTMLSPYLQRPLELGADYAVHSATKWLSGHADLTAGVVVVASDEIAEDVRFVQNAEGTALAPFEAWLLLRGLKTLGIRLDRQQANARRIAATLRARPEVTALHWIGKEDHPDRSVHVRQADGDGAVLSFCTGNEELSTRIVAATRLFATTVSFGSLHSTISLPCRMSHASIPEESRGSRCLPPDLVRISVGIEDVDDLIADLARAFTMSTRPGDVSRRPRRTSSPATARLG